MPLRSTEPRQAHREPSRLRRGFTLIEAAIVSAIVGIGIVSLLQLLAAGSMVHGQSSQLTTAIYLANNVNELMQGASYATLKTTYDNQTYNPPRDGRGVNLASFDGWSQVIDVQYVDPDLITSPVPDTQVEDMSRVTVQIIKSGETIYRTSWIVSRPQ